MPFKDFKREFESLIVTVRPDGYSPDADRDLALDLLVFRYLELRCLFEIAGNLDTIAVCQREILKHYDEFRREKDA